MSTNKFLADVDQIAHQQGWTEETLLNLALRFMGDRTDGTDERFLAFLEKTRDQEIEESYPEDSEPSDDCDGGDMDGDAESALASAGFGTDEDYGGSNDDGDFGDF